MSFYSKVTASRYQIPKGSKLPIRIDQRHFVFHSALKDFNRHLAESNLSFWARRQKFEFHDSDSLLYLRVSWMCFIIRNRLQKSPKKVQTNLLYSSLWLSPFIPFLKITIFCIDFYKQHLLTLTRHFGGLSRRGILQKKQMSVNLYFNSAGSFLSQLMKFADYLKHFEISRVESEALANTTMAASDPIAICAQPYYTSN